MRWFVRLLFPLLAVLASVQMFVLKYRVIEKEDELKRIHRQIWDDTREIHILEADWALASDPNRLRAFVESQTDFKTIQAKQLVTMDSLPVKPAPAPTPKPELPPEDAP